MRWTIFASVVFLVVVVHCWASRLREEGHAPVTGAEKAFPAFGGGGDRWSLEGTEGGGPGWGTAGLKKRRYRRGRCWAVRTAGNIGFLEARSDGRESMATVSTAPWLARKVTKNFVGAGETPMDASVSSHHRSASWVGGNVLCL